MNEDGDAFLRPTNEAWRCPKCGQRLFTVSVIEGHKQRCKGSAITVPKVVTTWTSPATGRTWSVER